MNIDLFNSETSNGVTKVFFEQSDGKKCYEQKVVLTEDVAEPTNTAIIRVVPYEQTAKGANSGTFKVTE